MTYWENHPLALSVSNFELYCFLHLISKLHIPKVICVIYLILFSGFLDRFLNLHIFTVIGRLMYCFFMVHIILMVYHVSSFQVLLPTFSNLPVVSKLKLYYNAGTYSYLYFVFCFFLKME